MQLLSHKNGIASLLVLYILPLVLNFGTVQGKGILLQHNNAINSSSHSPWLGRLNNRRPPPGCWQRPWICSQGQPPRVRRLCCRNRCVDVTSDVNNCGLCGIRCRFTRQCCRGICVNTNRNPFHCGKCDHRCRFPIRCIYGMCGYAQPLPPFPFPFPGPPRQLPDPPRGGGKAHPPRGGGKDHPPLR